MKYCLFLLLTSASFAQSAATMFTTDLNGRRVEAIAQQTTKDGGRTEISNSINGAKVPLQQSETKVLSQGPNGKTTETITRKFDANGQLSSTERVVSEEQKSGNKTTIRATVSRSDVQGRMVEAERRVVESVTQGATTTSNVNIARPGLSGSFETAEKRTVTTTSQANKTEETEMISRPSLSGQFTEAAKTVKETQQTGGKTVETTANFELGYTGKLQLIKQQVSTTSKAADGTETTEVNMFGVNSDGVPRDERTETKLKEQQIVVRKKAAGDTIVEATSVRRPSLADQSKLGSPVKISETTCSGKCDGPLPNSR